MQKSGIIEVFVFPGDLYKSSVRQFRKRHSKSVKAPPHGLGISSSDRTGFVVDRHCNQTGPWHSKMERSLTQDWMSQILAGIQQGYSSLLHRWFLYRLVRVYGAWPLCSDSFMSLTCFFQQSQDSFVGGMRHCVLFISLRWLALALAFRSNRTLSVWSCCVERIKAVFPRSSTASMSARSQSARRPSRHSHSLRIASML